MNSLIKLMEDLVDPSKVVYEYSSTGEVKKLEVDVFDVEKFVKVNECKPITNPILFMRENMPSPDGLLSNEIFGITKEERAGIYGYVDLNSWFIDPSLYKALKRVDSKIANIVHGTKRYIINSSGELIEDEKGNTGLNWFKKNFDKIKFKTTDSRKRDIKLKYIDYGNKSNLLFIKKYIIIPAYFRDINSTGANVGVGGINKVYQSLLMAVKSLKETQDYGLDATDSICGRIQDIIVTIYDWFIGNTNSMIKEPGTGIAGKTGILKRANMTRTADYSSRLVLSASELKVERLEDLMVDVDHAAVPLAAICADFYPYMIFHIRRMFENEFSSGKFTGVKKDGSVQTYDIKNWQHQFSDEVIKAELKNYLHGYSNRFKPLTIELEGVSKPSRIKFKGKRVDAKNHNQLEESISNRDLLWIDIIYQAAVESTKNMHVLISRYPVDSRFNQFPIKIRVSSTKEVEPMMVDNEYYPFYPKIRQEDISKDTSNMFIDTMQFSNLYLDSIGGDYHKAIMGSTLK